MISETSAFVSLPHVCQLLQLLPARVRSIVLELRIEAAMIIDDVPHFREQDVEAIAARIAADRATS